MDATTVAVAIGAGAAAFGATVFAAWPIVKKVREVVPPSPSASGSSPALPAVLGGTCAGCTHLTERVDGLEAREREHVALLHELIGLMRGRGGK